MLDRQARRSSDRCVCRKRSSHRDNRAVEASAEETTFSVSSRSICNVCRLCDRVPRAHPAWSPAKWRDCLGHRRSRRNGSFRDCCMRFFFFFFCFFFMGFQLAREHGAGRIVCTVSDEKKRAACIKAGATDVVVLAADSKRWTEQLKSALPDGCDVCYEICGGDLFECCMRVMSSYGRLLVIGFTSGTIPSAKANLPLVKGFSIVGVRSGAELLLKPELMRQMEDAMQASRIHPEIEVFPVHAAKEAFTKLANREAVGKLVLDFSSVSSKL
jgi:hypothetical protein